MKKIISLLTTVLMFTYCVQQERETTDIPVLPYEILAPAGTPTKTATTDNMKIVWVTDDALSVFHAPTGTDQFVNDGLFTIDDNIGEYIVRQYNAFKNNGVFPFAFSVCFGVFGEVYPYRNSPRLG